jgi:hypothetical protein
MGVAPVGVAPRRLSAFFGRICIVVFKTRRPHAERVGVLLVCLRHRGPASVSERVDAIGAERADEESVLGAYDEGRCAGGGAGGTCKRARRDAARATGTNGLA